MNTHKIEKAICVVCGREYEKTKKGYRKSRNSKDRTRIIRPSFCVTCSPKCAKEYLRTYYQSEKGKEYRKEYNKKSRQKLLEKNGK